MNKITTHPLTSGLSLRRGIVGPFKCVHSWSNFQGEKLVKLMEINSFFSAVLQLKCLVRPRRQHSGVIFITENQQMALLCCIKCDPWQVMICTAKANMCFNTNRQIVSPKLVIDQWHAAYLGALTQNIWIPWVALCWSTEIWKPTELDPYEEPIETGHSPPPTTLRTQTKMQPCN